MSPDLWDASSSDITDIASTVPDADPATANTPAPTWPGAYGCWRQSWWYSKGWDQKPGVQTDVPYAAETGARVAKSGENPWAARSDDRPPPLPLVAPGTQLLRSIPWTPPDGNAVPVTPRRTPAGLRDDQDVTVHPFH